MWLLFFFFFISVWLNAYDCYKQMYAAYVLTYFTVFWLGCKRVCIYVYASVCVCVCYSLVEYTDHCNGFDSFHFFFSLYYSPSQYTELNIECVNQYHFNTNKLLYFQIKFIFQNQMKINYRKTIRINKKPKKKIVVIPQRKK